MKGEPTGEHRSRLDAFQSSSWSRRTRPSLGSAPTRTRPSPQLRPSSVAVGRGVAAGLGGMFRWINCDPLPDHGAIERATQYPVHLAHGGVGESPTDVRFADSFTRAAVGWIGRFTWGSGVLVTAMRTWCSVLNTGLAITMISASPEFGVERVQGLHVELRKRRRAQERPDVLADLGLITAASLGLYVDDIESPIEQPVDGRTFTRKAPERSCSMCPRCLFRGWSSRPWRHDSTARFHKRFHEASDVITRMALPGT
jgi:hypothetical protein